MYAELLSRPAYGFQRRLGQAGDVDDHGYLVSHPQEPMWDVYAVDGDVALEELAMAWRSATADIDALDFRLRRVDDSFMVERHAAVPADFESFSVANCLSDGALHPDAVAALSDVVSQPRCAPGVATARLRVVRGRDTTLIAIAVDHTVGDGWSLALLVRRFALAHRMVRAGKPIRLRQLERFADFLDRVPDVGTRQRNLRAWGEILADAAPPGPPTKFEPTDPDLDQAYYLDTHNVFPLPSVATRAVSVLSQRYGATAADIWMAAASLAATRCSQGPQPCITMHHGRTRRADLRVFGPLTEAHVVPAVAPNGTVEDQLHRGRNLPPLFGETLREAGLSAPRRFAIDHVPSSPPLVLGADLRGRSLTGGELEPLKPPSTEPFRSSASVWITVFPLGSDRCEILVQAASSALPDAEVLISAIHDAIVDEAF